MESVPSFVCPKISVVIPVYNMESFLPRCLDSLKAQTFTDFEVICVDDGSKDGSFRLLNTYAAKDSRIRIIGQKNGGVSAARNRGFEAATGTYIYCIDPDDLIHPKCLEIAYAAITRENTDFVCFTWERFSEAYSFGEESSEDMAYDYTAQPFQTWFGKPAEKYGFMPTVWRFLFRKDVIGDLRFETWMKDYEDIFFILLFLLRARNGAFIKNKLYYYYQRPGSLSRAAMTGRRLDYTYFILKEVFDHCLTDINRLTTRKYLVPRLVKSFDKILQLDRKYKKINAIEFREGVVAWQRCVSMLLKENILYLRYFTLRWRWNILMAVLRYRLK